MRERLSFNQAVIAEHHRHPSNASGARRRWLWLTMILAGAALLLGGCIYPGQRDQEAVATPSAGYASDEIAAVAATGAVHSSTPVKSGKFGEGQATVGEQYFSALGVPCRKVLFISSAGGSGRELTVCMEKGGMWATAPDIFSGPVAAAAVPQP